MPNIQTGSAEIPKNMVLTNTTEKTTIIISAMASPTNNVPVTNTIMRMSGLITTAVNHSATAMMIDVLPSA